MFMKKRGLSDPILVDKRFAAVGNDRVHQIGVRCVTHAHTWR